MGSIYYAQALSKLFQGICRRITLDHCPQGNYNYTKNSNTLLVALQRITQVLWGHSNKGSKNVPPRDEEKLHNRISTEESL